MGAARHAPGQVVAGGEHDFALFQHADTGSCAAMVDSAARAHLYEHERAIGFTHYQIDFTTAASWRSIIACDQPQAGLLQMAQGRVFEGITRLLGVANPSGRPEPEKTHS